MPTDSIGRSPSLAVIQLGTSATILSQPSLYLNRLSPFTFNIQMLIPDNFGQVSTGGAPTGALPYDPLSTSLMQLIATILNCLAKNNPMMSASDASAERMSSSGDSFSSRANDIIRSALAAGLFIIIWCFKALCCPALSADQYVRMCCGCRNLYLY